MLDSIKKRLLEDFETLKNGRAQHQQVVNEIQGLQTKLRQIELIVTQTEGRCEALAGVLKEAGLDVNAVISEGHPVMPKPRPESEAVVTTPRINRAPEPKPEPKPLEDMSPEELLAEAKKRGDMISASKPVAPGAEAVRPKKMSAAEFLKQANAEPEDTQGVALPVSQDGGPGMRNAANNPVISDEGE